ncbi:uncharacterized protein LOC109510755 isoform X1 [Hippocampus comes]|uniref:uncharacterized protein LOC109510755 isoform X1 n=2 Tax=Hippocampus comes TaxID=109280 RepID=UPI00094EABC2|nr:PREDICTED: uncharacterized protein LOC109510755 isoform X1 [Hippocampus comes]
MASSCGPLDNPCFNLPGWQDDCGRSLTPSIGSKRQGLNRGDYSLLLSVTLTLTLALFYPLFQHPMFWPSFVYFGAAMTTVGGVHRGYLRKYGGFMFKQWKDKYVVLSLEGSLLVCRDGESPPDQVVDLQSHCEMIVEGREILDLPRLPAGGRRDCCFALILQQNKFLLMLADNPEDCTLWLKLIRKVREGVMSPTYLQRQRSITRCITDRDPLPDSGSDKDPGSPRPSEGTPLPSAHVSERGGSLRERSQSQVVGPRRPLRSVSVTPPHRVSDCLRHGNSSDARAVRAVCLLMGGAAASSALGYLNSCSPLAGRASEMVHAGSGGFSEMPAGGSFHACDQDVDSDTHFNSFDFEGDSDFDAFDCGGFAF